MLKWILFLCVSLSTYASQDHHDHSGHNWLGDTDAYQSVETHKSFEGFNYNRPNEFKSFNQFLGLLNSELIDLEFFRTKLAELVGEQKISRKSGKKSLPKSRCQIEDMKKVVTYLMEEYNKLGYEVGSLNDYPNTRIQNFFARKKGSDSSKTLLVSSHIDSVCNNGANDDGSGTIAALVIAKAIAKLDLKYNVAFVGFDREEVGLVGSKAFVKALKNPKSIIADIQMEMMATDSDQDAVFHVIDCDRPDSNYITDMIAKNILEHKLPIKINEACTTRSDHSSFWNAKIPAVVVSENFFGRDSDRCYHRSCDVLDDRIDFNYMGFITEALARTIVQIANP